jgi:hypothetical protein
MFPLALWSGLRPRPDTADRTPRAPEAPSLGKQSLVAGPVACCAGALSRERDGSNSDSILVSDHDRRRGAHRYRVSRCRRGS